jgi:hypothetical protein
MLLEQIRAQALHEPNVTPGSQPGRVRQGAARPCLPAHAGEKSLSPASRAKSSRVLDRTLILKLAGLIVRVCLS